MPDLSTTLSTSSPQIPHIFALIIHYGNPTSTVMIDAQLAKQADRKTTSIIIDHGPKQFPQNQVLHAQVISQENNGYAAGIKRGLQEVKNLGAKADDIVIILNNDAVISQNFLSSLRKWWKGQPSSVFAGAYIGSVNLLSGRAHINHQPKFPWELPYLHGSVLAAHYKTWKRLSLPMQFFLYWEDVAISTRARAIGAKLIALPRSIFQHNDQPRINSMERTYYLVRNGAAFLENESPHIWKYWWRTINKYRARYHQIIGKPQIARALQDRTDAYE